jgi:hypothetical protein
MKYTLSSVLANISCVRICKYMYTYIHIYMHACMHMCMLHAQCKFTKLIGVFVMSPYIRVKFAPTFLRKEDLQVTHIVS